MNPLFPKIITGTTGELLVQLRLFQYGVQASVPRVVESKGKNPEQYPDWEYEEE